MAWYYPEVAFSLQISLQQHPVKTFLSIQADTEQREGQKAGTHDEKWPKMAKNFNF